MLTYTIRRLVLSIPTLLFISLVIFLLLELAPRRPDGAGAAHRAARGQGTDA